MKKNMLTVIVIALSVINVVLTAVIVFAVVPTMNQTNQLIKQVASVIDLELESPDATGENATVSVEDTVSYKIEQSFTINLKKGADGKDHYAVMDSITIYQDSTHEDYEKLTKTVEGNASFITETVNNVISEYTIDNASASRAEMKAEILKRIQNRFGSSFIYDLSFGNLIFQ